MGMTLYDFRVMLESHVPLWVYGTFLTAAIAGSVYLRGRKSQGE
jgi:hypothetical protein